MRGLCCALTVMAVLGASCAHAPSVQPRASMRLAHPADLPGLPNFSPVSASLYRGAQPSRDGFERLRQMGVKTVVDLRGASHIDDLQGLGFHYVKLPSSAANVEQENIIEFLRTVNDPANQPVFVHCSRGADRTGVYVAAYRRVDQGWSAQDAKAELPNFGFFPLWQEIPAYIENMNVSQLREQANQSAASRPVTRQSKSSPLGDHQNLPG